MPSRSRRPRLTYANVMSTIALFLALGGASYAASDALAPNSVGRRQLRSRAVTPAKLAFGYQMGARDHPGQHYAIGEVGCPKSAVKCHPPVFPTIGLVQVRLSRPARIMIAVTNVVTNNSNSQGASVGLFAGVTGSPCFAETSIPRASAETVSCLGATGNLRAGRHRIGIEEGATGTRYGEIRASAGQINVVWWTLPPSRRQP